MDITGLPIMDLLGAFVGFILTLMVFSYIFGDNILFRLAIYVFVGVSAGYAAVIAIYNVILPQVITPLFSGNLADLRLGIPLLLGTLFVFAKLSPRLNMLGAPMIAYLVGVGAATVIGGAIVGTLFPQTIASINLLDIQAAELNGFGILGGAFILFGTLVTLTYFHFSARSGRGGQNQRPSWLELPAIFGKVFIVITLGVLFAGVYAAALTALIERINFILEFGISLIPF